MKGEWCNVHQSSSTAAFDQRNPPSLRRKRPYVPSSLNTVGVTPTDTTATPASATIPSHISFSTIPTHVTAGTNNGSENYISDGIPEIVQMGSIPADIVALVKHR